MHLHILHARPASVQKSSLFKYLKQRTVRQSLWRGCKRQRDLQLAADDAERVPCLQRPSLGSVVTIVLGSSSCSNGCSVDLQTTYYKVVGNHSVLLGSPLTRALKALLVSKFRIPPFERLAKCHLLNRKVLTSSFPSSASNNLGRPISAHSLSHHRHITQHSSGPRRTTFCISLSAGWPYRSSSSLSHRRQS